MFKKYRIVSKARFALFIITMLIIILGSINLFFRPEYVSGSTETIFDTVTVKSGDTLWDIASRYANDNIDIRMFIYDISKINGLDTSELFPGQEILIPVF